MAVDFSSIYYESIVAEKAKKYRYEHTLRIANIGILLAKKQDAKVQRR